MRRALLLQRAVKFQVGQTIYLLRSILSAALLSSLTVAALGCVPAKKELFPPAPGAPTERIWVVSHGWHTGLVLPVRALPQDLCPEIAAYTGTPFVEIGWGDEGFYRASKITVLLTLDAIFIPDPSVLHVVAVPVPPHEYFNHSTIVAVELSKEGFTELSRFVCERFAREDNRPASPLGSGIYGTSYFFRANGDYYFPKTCNTWTARALRRAGLPMSWWYSLTASNVIYQLRGSGKVIRE